MINRQNYLDMQDYLNYTEKVKQNDPLTVKRTRGFLRHLLEWANEKPFTKAKEISPVFPVYLLSANNSNISNKQLAPATMKKTCENARQFFVFCKREYPKRYSRVPTGWIDTIRPPRYKGMQSELKTHEFFTIDDILKIANLEVNTRKQLRDKAAACFLYLSGMRVTAFTSLPISAINLEEGRVKQLPTLGVKTKNSKAAITTLLRIPELLEVVKKWSDELESLPKDNLWYCPMKGDSHSLSLGTEPGEGRRIIFERGLKKICEMAGIKYLSPHKLRHGHVIYALKRVKDMAGLKAVSQNVMHSSVGITDSIYGGLLVDDVHNIISGIDPHETKETQDLGNLATLLADILRNNPEIVQNNLRGKIQS